VVGEEVLNVICVYTPQVGLADDIKRVFWEEQEEVMHSVPQNEKLCMGGDFNGHIRAKTNGYDRTHGGFGFGERNNRRVALLDFAITLDLTIVNFLFKKKRESLSDLQE